MRFFGFLLPCLFIASVAAARADFVSLQQPSTNYIEKTTRLDSPSMAFEVLGVSNGSQAVVFDHSMLPASVPYNWASWNAPPAVETQYPQVLMTGGRSSLWLSLESPASVFGFELSPDQAVPAEVIAYFFNAQDLVGTIERSPSGNNGALLFAAASSTDTFSYVYIDSLSGDDFAIGNIRYSSEPVNLTDSPEPASSILATLACFALCAYARLFRHLRTC
jgi:hypothetical protein